jgi:glycerophosphoryl diester phosphodiesterase
MSKAFWENSGGPLAIAHRGGNAAGQAKENTIEAFQAAYDLGYRYAETDILLAASGELVLMHGSGGWLQAAFKRDITRSTFQKMTLNQIRAIFKPGGAQVPTLEEALVRFPKMKFFLDLKTDETAEPVAQLIKRLVAAEQVCVTGFSYRRARRFIKAASGLGVNTGVTIDRRIRINNFNMLMLKSGLLTNVEAVFIHHSHVSPQMLDLIHKRGLKAVIWTCNSPLSIKNALSCGADGVISDNIKLLKEILASN